MSEYIRHALIVGITTFGDDGERAKYHTLDFTQTRASQLSEALAEFGYSCTQPPDSQLGSHELGAAVRDAIVDARESAAVVVHVLSHGCVSDRTGSLYVVGSDGQHGPQTKVEHWLSHVEDFAGPQVLFLLDLCHAGAAARLPWQLDTADASNRTWVIGGCE